MPKNNRPYLIIDFDSTLVQVESMEELADIVLEGRADKQEVLEKIKNITDLGMKGKLDFPTSLAQRLNLLPVTKDHLHQLVVRLRQKITPSAKQNRNFFLQNFDRIFVISGGFSDFIVPVVGDLGIQRERILANEFHFDIRGQVTGFDPDNFLAQKDGKVKQVRDLNLKDEVWVIGDGWADYQIKEGGAADKFVAFTENISRKEVKKQADMVADSFKDIIDNY